MKNLVPILIIFFSFQLNSQTQPFEISLEAIEIEGIGGIQSYAFGQSNGKWLIVGGRLDGLHRRQPWASFDLAGHNNQLIVIDPDNKKHWSAPLSLLPLSIYEQLKSTNMQFYQEGEYLYCLGGYGHSEIEDNHTTFPNLTAIHVEKVIHAIMNDEDISPWFRQITDLEFQVTGGRLRKIGKDFYLLGGQKFIGRYNPMGPDHGQGFEQEYTNAIKVFEILDDGNNVSIQHLNSYVDDQLHRRDYNAESQIMPGGQEGITMYSGVFQVDVDLPFLNCVDIDSEGFTVNSNFQQLYNHYHCPALPVYSEITDEMHTVFFGGIAQFYQKNGQLVQDDNVPFVKTIARVSRNSDGLMGEHLMPVEMPGLLGASAEFIPNFEIPHFDNHVFDLDQIEEEPVLIGHIFGGINSSGENIFFINNGTQSDASPVIFKVYLNKSSTSSDQNLPLDSEQIRPVVYPNPNKGFLNVELITQDSGDVHIQLWDNQQRLILEEKQKISHSGKHKLFIKTKQLISGGIYFISIKIGDQHYYQQIIMN